MIFLDHFEDLLPGSLWLHVAPTGLFKTTLALSEANHASRNRDVMVFTHGTRDEVERRTGLVHGTQPSGRFCHIWPNNEDWTGAFNAIPRAIGGLRPLIIMDEINDPGGAATASSRASNAVRTLKRFALEYNVIALATMTPYPRADMPYESCMRDPDLVTRAVRGRGSIDDEVRLQVLKNRSGETGEVLPLVFNFPKSPPLPPARSRWERIKDGGLDVEPV